jgi:hypothetical protein
VSQVAEEKEQDNGIWRQALECRPKQEQNNWGKLTVFYFLVLCSVPYFTNSL